MISSGVVSFITIRSTRFVIVDMACEFLERGIEIAPGMAAERQVAAASVVVQLAELFPDEKSTKLDKLLEPEEDSVRFYYVCARCTVKAETVGAEKPAEKGVFIV